MNYDDEVSYNNYDDDYDYEDDFEDDFDFEDEHDYISKEGFKLLSSEIEYYVDGEKVTKEEYDDAWDDRLGYLGSSNWEENGLSIINTDTEEIIFTGKIS